MEIAIVHDGVVIQTDAQEVNGLVETTCVVPMRAVKKMRREDVILLIDGTEVPAVLAEAKADDNDTSGVRAYTLYFDIGEPLDTVTTVEEVESEEDEEDADSEE